MPAIAPSLGDLISDLEITLIKEPQGQEPQRPECPSETTEVPRTTERVRTLEPELATLSPWAA